MKIATTLMAALLCCAVPPATEAGQTGTHRLTKKERATLAKAPEVLQALTSAPDKGIPRDLLERAECILVFPSVTKGAFIVGGKHGRGVATCRQTDGRMGSPAFFEIGGGSVGWQFGGSKTDLVLLVMNENGMEALLRDEFTVGGEASAAIGPVGRTASAATDAQLKAQILSWSRTRGLFVGASLDGAVVKADKESNLRVYDKPAREVFKSNSIGAPPEAQPFMEVAQKLAYRSDVSENR